MIKGIYKPTFVFVVALIFILTAHAAVSASETEDGNVSYLMNSGEPSTTLKFEGTVLSDISLIGARRFEVRIDNRISGPEPCKNPIVVEMQVGPYCNGYIDSDIEVGDNVEVYGIYAVTGFGGAGCYVDLCMNGAYIRKISDECCPCEIITDKETYKPDDPITITVRFCGPSTSGKTICGDIPSVQSFSFTTIDGCDGFNYAVWREDTGLYNKVNKYTNKYIRLTGVVLEDPSGNGGRIIGFDAIEQISGCSACGIGEYCDPKSFSVLIHSPDKTVTLTKKDSKKVSTGTYMFTGTIGDLGPRTVEVNVEGCPTMEKEFYVTSCCPCQITTRDPTAELGYINPANHTDVIVRFASQCSDTICGRVTTCFPWVHIKGCGRHGVNYYVLSDNSDIYNELCGHVLDYVRLTGVVIKGYGILGDPFIGGYDTIEEISSCSECEGEQYCNPSSFSVLLHEPPESTTDITEDFYQYTKGIYRVTLPTGDVGTKRIEVSAPGCPPIERELHLIGSTICGQVHWSLEYVSIEACDGLTYPVVTCAGYDLHDRLKEYDGKNVLLSSVVMEGYVDASTPCIADFDDILEISNCSECESDKFIDGCTEISSPGYYKLISDIPNSAAQCCIKITSSDVTFDGDGHLISAAEEYGVETPPDRCAVCVGSSTTLSNVTVKNIGIIRDWGSGIRFDNVKGGKIENNNLWSSNHYGILLRGSSKINITNNEVNSCNDGIFLMDSNSNKITNNTASANYDGIGFIRSSNNEIRGNTASSGYLGIDLYQGSNNNVIADNTVEYNRQHGLYIDNSSTGNTIKQNFICSNNQLGGDFYDIDNNATNSGDENTCETTYKWNDTGTIGCTYKCKIYNVSNCMEINSPGYYKLTKDITNSSAQCCINITSSNVIFDGNGHIVAGINALDSYGVCVGSSNTLSDVTVKNITVNNWYYGIYFENVENGKIEDNTASENKNGIILSHSTKNNITNNIANSNNGYGIYLTSSSNNVLIHNMMSENNYNFGVLGISRSSYLNNIDMSNMVDGKTVYYWVNKQNRQVPGDAGFVGIVSSANITVKDLKLTNNLQGMLFAYTNDSLIENVTASNNYNGIYLISSSNNLIYNNIFNNTINFNISSSQNRWNTTKTLGTNIVGGNYLGGNAWLKPYGFAHSQTCIDLDIDKICDGCYKLDANNIDYLPLWVPRPNISIQSVTAGGAYKLYTVGENEVKITVKLNNTGSVDGKAIVRLEDLPREIGKQVRLVTVPKDEIVSASFTFNISDYDPLDGWTGNGFYDADSYSFLVNVTNLLGTEIYDTTTSNFIVKEGPEFWGFFPNVDYDSNQNGTIEVGEYFLLKFSITNAGDENVSEICIDNSNIRGGFEGGYLRICNYTGLNVDKWWDTSHLDAYAWAKKKNIAQITKEEVAEAYQWQATITGVARLNFKIDYKGEDGNSYITSLRWPITFPIYDHTRKTLKEPKVVKGGDFEVTVFGVEGNNVSAKIRNKGGVYYTYKINRQPTDFWGELRNFLAPGGQDKKTIITKGVATNYKFAVRYDYSQYLNSLDGIINAISPVLPPKLENIPLLIDILLVCAQGNVDEQKLAEQGAGYLFDELKDPNSQYHKAVMKKVTKEFGEDVAGQLTEELMGKLVKLPMALYKGLQWTWNNLKADVYHEFYVTVTDPPQEYNVSGETIPGPLFFGGLSNETSTMGEGNISISINESGEGEYCATYEINTLDTSLIESDFETFSKLVISEVGRRNSSVMRGNVTIYIFLTPDSPANLYEILLADIGFAESIIESYFIKMESFESRLVEDHIELRGTGELQSSIYDNEVDINIQITERKINANFYQRGRYAELTDGGIKADIHFGPRFNIPLNNTRLSISVPYDVGCVSPEPDYINSRLHWNSTPPNIIIHVSAKPEVTTYDYNISGTVEAWSTGDYDPKADYANLNFNPDHKPFGEILIDWETKSSWAQIHRLDVYDQTDDAVVKTTAWNQMGLGRSGQYKWNLSSLVTNFSHDHSIRTWVSSGTARVPTDIRVRWNVVEPVVR